MTLSGKKIEQRQISYMENDEADPEIGMRAVLFLSRTQSLAEARALYAKTTVPEEVSFTDIKYLMDDMERLYSKQLEGASRIRDTRVGIYSVPPWPEGIRSNLNKKIHNKISNGLEFLKVETIYSIKRLAELLYNYELHLDHLSNYHIRFYVPEEIIINVDRVPSSGKLCILPRMNVTVFDDNSALMGGFHVQKPTKDEPLAALYGRRGAEFAGYYWNALWNSAQDLFVDGTQEAFRIADFLEINGKEKLRDLLMEFKSNPDFECSRPPRP